MGSVVECGEEAELENENLIETFKYVCDGILVSLIGLVGVLGNVTSIVVLARPRLRDCFHRLLLALAVFDTIYIVFGGINYTMKAFEQANTRIYTLTFPHVIYPFTNIGLSGTIFMTVAISIERFLGVCYPLHLPPHTRKSWFYILPVIFLSICINIPKFFEARVTWHNDEHNLQVLMSEMEELEELSRNFTSIHYIPAIYIPSIRPTELRTNSSYIKYYITYFRLFFMAVLPLLLMIFFNVKIAIDVKTAKVQRFGSKRKMNKEVNFCIVLLCIVTTFICCHAPRTFLDIWEFSHVENIVRCNENQVQYIPKRWVICLSYVSHFAGVLNSSINFLIYCFVGRNFRREFFKLIHIRSEDFSHTRNQSLMDRTQSMNERRAEETPKLDSEKRQVL